MSANVSTMITVMVMRARESMILNSRSSRFRFMKMNRTSAPFTVAMAMAVMMLHWPKCRLAAMMVTPVSTSRPNQIMM